MTHVLGLILILLVIVILHELGHALAGIIVGAKINTVYIGLPLPYIPKVKFTKWNTNFVLSPILVGGGVSSKDIVNMSAFKKIVYVLGGPAISILPGLILALFSKIFLNANIALLLSTTIPEYWHNWLQLSSNPTQIFAFFFAFSLLIGAYNLIPIYPMDGGILVSIILYTFGISIRNHKFGNNLANGYAFLCIWVLASPLLIIFDHSYLLAIPFGIVLINYKIRLNK